MTVETTNTENAQNETVDESWKQSPWASVFEGSKAALEDLANEHNALVARIKAEGSEQDQVNEILANSQDENVVKYRAWREEMENDLANGIAEIENYAKANLVSRGEFDVEAATTEASNKAEMWKKLTSGLKAFDGSESFLNSVPKLNGLKSSGNATGQQRWRLANLEIKLANQDDSEYHRVFKSEPVLDKDKKPTGEFTEVQTFTVLSQKLKEITGRKVDVKSIYDHAGSARTEDNRPFVFAYSVAKADGTTSDNFMIRVTPKSD